MKFVCPTEADTEHAGREIARSQEAFTEFEDRHIEVRITVREDGAREIEVS